MKLIFLATEDWFVRSHFAPLVRRAREEGYDVAVAARGEGEIEGARFIPMPFERGAVGAVLRETHAVQTLLRRERPDIVHAIALKPIALLSLAGAQGAGRVFALTGRGYSALGRAPWAHFASNALAGRVAKAVRSEGAVLTVENAADRAWVENGRALPDERVVLMPGAGVDPEAYVPAPEPPAPIVLGIVARLIASKGVDVAVAAIAGLRKQGFGIELRIAGAPDPDNPEQVSDAEIARWRATDGVSVLGRVDDIAAFWASAHIACLPSRGGEGLPRSLLEAAACARPIVTTDVPGCRDFADGVGLIAEPGNAGALAEALAQLARDAGLRRKLGAAGRERVCAGYTTRHAANAAARAWRMARA